MNKPAIYKALSVFLILAAPFYGTAQINQFVLTDNRLRNHTDSIVHNAAIAFMKNPGKVGFSVGVINHGLFYQYHYGEIAPGTGKLPTGNTLYEIGSITKTFTALLLAHALMEHKINLNDDIRKYLKGDYPNLQYTNGQPVKVAYVVSHIARLPRSFTKPIDSTFTESDFVNELHAIKLDSVLPYRYNYSNLGYQLLGHLLENAYGTAYAELLKKYVTNPYHMPATQVYANAAKLMKGYNLKREEMPATPGLYPGAGALRSDLNDMMKYLNAGLKENDAAISITHRLIFNTSESADAVPWAIGRTRNWDYYIREDGGTKGFRTFITMFPDEQIGIVLLSNETDDNAGNQLYNATNSIFNGLKAH